MKRAASRFISLAYQHVAQASSEGVLTNSGSEGRLIAQRMASNASAGSSGGATTGASRLESIGAAKRPSPHAIDPIPSPVGLLERHKRALAAIPTVPKLLGFAGAIPFTCLVPYVVEALGVPAWIDQAAKAQVAYGALIVTFLGAVHWGVAMNSTLTGPRAAALMRERYIWSVFPSITALPALLMETGPASFVITLLLGICYLSDRSYGRMGAVPSWYTTLRGWLTALAMSSMLATTVYYASRDVARAKAKMEEEEKAEAARKAAAAAAAAAPLPAAPAAKGWGWGRK